jgi:hypothetical protein
VKTWIVEALLQPLAIKGADGKVREAPREVVQARERDWLAFLLQIGRIAHVIRIFKYSATVLVEASDEEVKRLKSLPLVASVRRNTSARHLIGDPRRFGGKRTG